MIRNRKVTNSKKEKSIKRFSYEKIDNETIKGKQTETDDEFNETLNYMCIPYLGKIVFVFIIIILA